MDLSKREKSIFVLLFIVSVVVFPLAYISTPSGALEVHFLDVGQGDSIFVQTPNGYQILIDGGPQGSGAIRGLSKVMPFYDRSIDLVVASHLDADHIGGLLYVLDRFSVDAVLVSQVYPSSALGERFFETIEEKNIKLIKVSKGDRFRLDNNIKITTLWPPMGYAGKNNNDSSVVFKLEYKKDSFLFTGDTERFGEIMLANKSDISAEVLKVAHHGSNSSSTDYFVSKVNPKLAVIQVGENRYGHPHKSVLKRLRDRGTEVLRNDKNGVISIYSYGDSI